MVLRRLLRLALVLLVVHLFVLVPFRDDLPDDLELDRGRVGQRRRHLHRSSVQSRICMWIMGIGGAVNGNAEEGGGDVIEFQQQRCRER